VSFINNLIRQAKAAPHSGEMTVPCTKVDALVEHILSTRGWGCSRETVRKYLIAGEVTLLGCRLRVVGKVPQ